MTLAPWQAPKRIPGAFARPARHGPDPARAGCIGPDRAQRGRLWRDAPGAPIPASGGARRRAAASAAGAAWAGRM